MQTQYQSIVELAQAVETARVAKKDFIADTKELRLHKDGALVVRRSDNHYEPFPVNEHAHGQIAARLQIPKPYYDRMRRDAPELLADNVNTWFSAQPDRRMVRTINGHVRAFLSDKYQRVENEEILATLLPVLREYGSDLSIKSLALTESRMYLKATVPSIKSEVRVGEIVEAGIEVRNGEIGNSRFEVWPFANKLICQNGMRMSIGGFKKTHVGARADVTDDVYEMLTDETLKADDRAFMLKARDVVKATLTEATFEKMVAKMREAADPATKIADPVKAVEVLRDRFDFNETDGASILRSLIEGADLTQWGVANAITHAAQSLPSYDRSDEFEGIGGKIVELAPSEWQKIAA